MSATKAVFVLIHGGWHIGVQSLAEQSAEAP